jgi:UDP-glucose 4-epimerase
LTTQILIIGGNGYIGSRLIRDLSSSYDMSSVDVCWFGKNLGYSHEVDYRTLSRQYISKFDVIILLAGHSSVKMCEGTISSSWINNVNNFIELVGKIDKSQLLIYASSGSVYGSQSLITSEDVSLQFRPINYYDLTKYSIDVHVQNFIKEGYKIIGFRFGTVNGYSPNLREDLMINSMTKRSVEQGTILINNKNISRPILGIADITRVVDKVIQNPISGIYNLASVNATVDGISTSVSELLSTRIVENPDVSGTYDFMMDVTKIIKTYDFIFQESIKSIVTEISNNIDHTTFSNRNRFIKYE